MEYIHFRCLLYSQPEDVENYFEPIDAKLRIISVDSLLFKIS